jgi:hypothetical protein
MPWVNQIQSSKYPTLCFFEIHFSAVLPSTLEFCNLHLSFRVLNSNLWAISPTYGLHDIFWKPLGRMELPQYIYIYMYPTRLIVIWFRHYYNTQQSTTFRNQIMCVLFIILYCTTCFGLLAGHLQVLTDKSQKNTKDQLLSNFSVDPPSHDIT